MSTIPDKNGQDAGIDPYNGKVLLAAVICLSVVIFFVLLLHGYARWVLRRRPIVAHVVTEPFHRRSLSAYPGHSTEAGLAPGTGLGLDAKVVASLPMFVYTAKEDDHQNGLHCVVCLSVMEEGEIGRLLPTCKHGFHVECIDMWLMSHSTCPICRAPVIKMDEMGLAGGDGVVVLVEVEDEPRRSNEELGVLSGTVEEGEVIVEMPICSTIAKGDESSNSTSSCSSSASSSSSSSSSSSVACSLKRMLSRSRSESKVFPSLPVS